MPHPNSGQLKSEITFTAERSRGPGGQNVNKVSSAAYLTWSYQGSRLLNETQKQMISSRLGHCINREGILYLRCDEFRDLPRNQARCLEKLDHLLERAFHQPKPRKASRPTRASREKKLRNKARRGELKRMRKRVSHSES